jgi:hypothetical protein
VVASPTAATDVRSASHSYGPANCMDGAAWHHSNHSVVVDKASYRTCLFLPHRSQEHRKGWWDHHRHHQKAPFGHWEGMLPCKVPFGSDNRAAGLCHTLSPDEHATEADGAHRHHGHEAHHIRKDPPYWR